MRENLHGFFCFFGFYYYLQEKEGGVQLEFFDFIPIDLLE